MKHFFCKCVTQDWNNVRAIYAQYDLLVGNTVTVMPKKKEDSGSFYTAKAVGFHKDGFLQVQVSGEDAVRNLIADEVTIRPEDIHDD
jgi:biotin-(acetyl-CoA carboxylase) ligase